MTSAAEEGEARTRDGVTLSFTLHRATLDRATLDRATGRPARIVLVHSLALDRSLWSGVVAGMAGRAEVAAYDCRGHGRSGRPHGPYTTGRFADDLADLLDHLGWPDAVVAGCSMGGCVAQAFAARHPARTRAALFVDTTAWYGPTAPQDWAARATAAREKGLAALVPFQLTRWFGDAFREANPAEMDRLAAVFTGNDLDCYAATCAMLGAADLRASAAGISCPTAVLVGEDDRATPPAMAHDLAERLGGAATVVPGTRHLTPLENPDAVVAALTELLTRSAAGVRP
jgi:3-oxoadipate enol-lactonase